MRVGRGCDADRVVAELEEIVTEGGAPCYLRCDNGPEFIAAALSDWCRFSRTGSVFHRARLAMAEPLRRIVQRQGAR